MTTLTTEELDRRLDTQSERILGFVKREFDEITGTLHEQKKDLTDVKENLGTLSKELLLVKDNVATLTTSVDRFAKIYTDLNQEFIVMRQHLRDVESRVEKIELKLKVA